MQNYFKYKMDNQFKRHRLPNWLKKKKKIEPTLSYLQKAHFKYKDSNR